MRKQVVISGATSGIGYEVAHQLAKQSFNLMVIARNEKKAIALKKSLADQSPDCIMDFRIADLSKIDTVKKVAEEIKDELETIDVLINNAGGVFSSFELSADGYEMTMANNHLSYFVLTHGLLPSLLKSKDGRIINVGSGSHYRGKIDFESFTKEKRYYILTAYRQSKLANLLFSYKLTRLLKETNISTFVLHPGTVKTPIGGKSKSWLHRTAWNVMSLFTADIEIEEVGKTFVYLSKEIEVKAHNGFYFHRGLIKKSSTSSYDEGLQQKLWDWSEKVTDVSYSSVLS